MRVKWQTLSFLLILSGCGDSSEQEATVDADLVLLDARPSARDAQIQEDATPDAESCPNPYLIYLNTQGLMLSDGDENSITNQFPNVNPQLLPPWPGTDLSNLLPCIEADLREFNIKLTTTDPGDVPHLEIVMTIASGDLDLLAVPVDIEFFTLLSGSCGNPNPISFVFNDSWVDDVHLCRGIGQAIGFGFGLNHATDCSDLLAQTTCENDGTYTDVELSCVGGSCRCGGETQNSFQSILQTTGPSCP